jgi:hypothetical protein
MSWPSWFSCCILYLHCMIPRSLGKRCFPGEFQMVISGSDWISPDGWDRHRITAQRLQSRNHAVSTIRDQS